MLYNLVNFIVAVDKKFGIGKDGEIPWFIREELKYFKELTEGNAVVMGSKTFFSIPVKFRPLKNRLNLVLTNNKDLLKNEHEYKNLIFFNFKTPNNILKMNNTDNSNPDKLNKLNKIFSMIRNNDIYSQKEIFIIGGQKIYEIFLDFFKELEYYELQLNKIYLTYIDKDYKCDTFFPKLTEDYKLCKYSDKCFSKEEDVYFRYLEYEKHISYTNTDEAKYLDIACNILNNGKFRDDRTGVGIYSIFGTQTRFDISRYVPILTTKRVPFKTCIHELLWFLNGDTNNKNLQDNNVHIWDGNSSREFLDKIGLDNLEENDCGACYGFQWRHFGAEYKDCNTDYTGKGFDQVQYVLNLLKYDPFSRRIFLSAWNSADLLKTCLPPCHVSIQFYVEEIDDIKYLSGHMYQRSADWFLGEPFNILSYTALIYLFAEISDMKPKELIISTGDTHLYSNHLGQTLEMISRTPLTKPKLWINPDVKNKELKDITIDDFDLIGYFSHPTIKGRMAV